MIGLRRCNSVVKGCFGVLLLLLLGIGVTHAQVVEQSVTDTASVKVSSTMMHGGTLYGLSDERTLDPEQHKRWKTGKEVYPAKPRDMWELGLHFGHFAIDGDVDRLTPFYSGFGFGVHARKSLYYVFSMRYSLFYGQAYGLEPQPYGNSLRPEQYVFKGYGPENYWFPSYRTRMGNATIEVIMNLGNLLFHKASNKWNLNVGVGVGGAIHDTYLDLRDENGRLYTNLVSATGWSYPKFDTRQGRKDIKAELNKIYDGTYETRGPYKKGLFRLQDKYNVNGSFTASVGVARKVNDRFNIGLEHKVITVDNDYLDGIKYRTNLDQTNNLDIGHYTRLILAYNVGSKKKKVEPLYWLNPLDYAYSDIAALKRRPKLDLTDSDEDGVLDMFDEEPETPANCPVDVKGRALDSDGDGIIDCKDDEPFSVSGYDVDEKGVAQIPDDVRPLNKGEVTKVIENTIATQGPKCCTPKWFLPMIHFDLDKYCIKPEFYPHMQHVATVMKQNPDLCVTVLGNTDSRNSNDYNKVLSYNRAKAAIDYLTSNYNIPRSRFKLMYGGEESPMAKNVESLHGKKREYAEYINRRVEFRVCEHGDVDMGRPEGPEAGHCDEYKPMDDTYVPSSTSPMYRGNKTSGF